MIKDMMKDAIVKMMESGEFEKIAKYEEKEGDADAAAAVFELEGNLWRVKERMGIESIPIIPLIQMINDAEVWKDIFTFMMTASESGKPDPKQITGMSEVVRWLLNEIDALSDVIDNPKTSADIGLKPYRLCRRTAMQEVLEKIREECCE